MDFVIEAGFNPFGARALIETAKLRNRLGQKKVKVSIPSELGR